MSESEDDDKILAKIMQNFVQPSGPPPPRPRRPSFYLNNPSLAPSQEFMLAQDASQLIANYHAAESRAAVMRTRLPMPASPVSRPRVYLPTMTRPDSHSYPASVQSDGSKYSNDPGVTPTPARDIEEEGKAGPDNQPRTPVRQVRRQSFAERGYRHDYCPDPVTNAATYTSFNLTPPLPKVNFNSNVPGGAFRFQTPTKGQAHLEEQPKSQFSSDSKDPESNESDHDTASKLAKRIASSFASLSTQVRTMRLGMEETVQKLDAQGAQARTGTWKDYPKHRKPPADRSGLKPIALPPPVTPTKDSKSKEPKAPKLSISTSVVSTNPTNDPTNVLENVLPLVPPRVKRLQSGSVTRASAADNSYNKADINSNRSKSESYSELLKDREEQLCEGNKGTCKGKGKEGRTLGEILKGKITKLRQSNESE